MAEYHDALKAKWPSVPGADKTSKLANLNALVVDQKALVRTDDIVNAIAPADFPTTTQALMQLQFLIGGRDVVDVSPGTTIRAMFLQIFNGKAATLAALAALVKLSDDAKVPWWKANGYPRPFDLGDIEAAGLN